MYVRTNLNSIIPDHIFSLMIRKVAAQSAAGDLHHSRLLMHFDQAFLMRQFKTPSRARRFPQDTEAA